MPRELHHNTPEQVAYYVQTAVDMLDALDIPDDLRPQAFALGVNLIASKQIVYEDADVSPVLRGLAMPRQ